MCQCRVRFVASLRCAVKQHNFRGFSLPTIRKFAVQLLRCLALLDRERLVHCDLKPENILLVRKGRSALRVIDFGSGCDEDKRMFTYIQSRFYRAPEVILGLPYGRPIDVWSFGCILAELYTGLPLFPGESERQQLQCIMETCGAPPMSMLAAATRQKAFFNSDGTPDLRPDSKGRLRKPGTKSLSQGLRTSDAGFVSFLSACLELDPTKRLTPADGMRHPWIQDGLTQLATTGSSAVAGWMGGSAKTAGAAASALTSAASGSAVANAETTAATPSGGEASATLPGKVKPDRAAKVAATSQLPAGAAAATASPEPTFSPKAAAEAERGAVGRGPQPKARKPIQSRDNTGEKTPERQAAAGKPAPGDAPTVTTAGAQDSSSASSAISSGVASPQKSSRVPPGADKRGSRAVGSPRDDDVVGTTGSGRPVITVPAFAAAGPSLQSGANSTGASKQALAVQASSPSSGEREAASFASATPRARGDSTGRAAGPTAQSQTEALRRPPLRRDGSQASSIATHMTSPKLGGARPPAESSMARAPNPSPPSLSTEAEGRGAGRPSHVGAAGSSSTTALRGRTHHRSATHQPSASLAGPSQSGAAAAGVAGAAVAVTPGGCALTPSAPGGPSIQRPGAKPAVSASSQGLRTRRVIRPAHSPAGSPPTSTARSSPRFAGSQAVLDEAKEEEEDSPRGVQSTRTLGGAARAPPLAGAGQSASMGRAGLLAATGLG